MARRSSPRLRTRVTETADAESVDENTNVENKSPSKYAQATRATRSKIDSKEANIQKEVNVHVDSDDDEDEEEEAYEFDGVVYKTYQEMVDAKRKRNQQRLMESGLLSMTAAAVKTRERLEHQHQQRGIVRNNKRASGDGTTGDGLVQPRRKSSRLAGVQADGLYVDDEKNGRFTLRGGNSSSSNAAAGHIETDGGDDDEFYRRRINDGSPMSLKEAVENAGSKWLKDESVAEAEILVRNTLGPIILNETKEKYSSKSSPGKNSAGGFSEKQFSNLRADDMDCVAKVVPERIYGIAVHPSPDKLIACAGDKTGYVGIWNVDHQKQITNQDADDNTGGGSTGSDGVHLFRFHNGAAACLQWTASGSSLFSASYDGTVRMFDVESETFTQVFGTYDADVKYKNELGYKMDTGAYHFWTQYACLDHRNDKDCMFLSTSVGTATHVDFRTKRRVTFHEELSEKKINTLSLHPNGHSLISAGLDCTVKLWDIRKFEDKRSSTKKGPAPLAFSHCGKSVNSAFFSPSSGKYIVATTMANKLELYENFHLIDSAGSKRPTKSTKSIYHDNMTGRWLSTFMAQWHPKLDYFVVGSMRKPRCIEVFDGTSGDCKVAVVGDALTAVASRCCFHPSTDRLTIVGGNSSGRVTIVR